MAWQECSVPAGGIAVDAANSTKLETVARALLLWWTAPAPGIEVP